MVGTPPIESRKLQTKAGGTPRPTVPFLTCSFQAPGLIRLAKCPAAWFFHGYLQVSPLCAPLHESLVASRFIASRSQMASVRRSNGA